MSIHDERTLTEVVQDVIANIQEIIRSEFQLAKVEIGDRVTRTRRPATMLGVGSLICLYAMGFILLSIVYKLSTVVEPWLAALIVGGVLALFGIVVLISAIGKLKQIDAVPRRSVETMKENMRWANKQIK
jgi:Putative Actinobacterial Holin-X, holin superfamily III